MIELSDEPAEHAKTGKQREPSCFNLPLWGEINSYNKWGEEEEVLRHGLGCQKELISLTNPRVRVSKLLQGKSSGEMAFFFFLFFPHSNQSIFAGPII